MPAVIKIDVLHAALKEAEDELCTLGQTLSAEGWDTGTIAFTLDVIRIALYGTDGAGNGPDEFESARARLLAFRVDEAAKAH